MISLLVLSNQESFFSEIQNSVGSNYVTHNANSIEQLNDSLVDGKISIVIIDASFIKTANQNEFVETLSFFPELTLIVAVESGETMELVNMFQNLEVYRYLQKPLNADQIKKCIDAASRKHSKNIENVEATFTLETKSNKNRLIIIALLILIITVAYVFFLPQKNVPTTISSSIEKPEKIEKQKSQAQNNDYSNADLLTLDDSSISLSVKSGLTINTNQDELLSLSEKEAKLTDNETKNNTESLSLDNETQLPKDHQSQINISKPIIKEELEKDSDTEKLVFIINNKIKAGNIITPAKDNASYFLNQLRDSNPDNDDTSLLEQEIIKRISFTFNRAIGNNEFNKAETIILTAKSYKLNSTKLASLEQQLEISIKKHNELKAIQDRKEELMRLSKLADNAIEEDRLIYPKKLNAKYYLQSALNIEPENKKILSQIDTLVSLLLIQIETDLYENTLASASSKIKITKELGVKLEELGLLEDKLNNAINKR